MVNIFGDLISIQGFCILAIASTLIGISKSGLKGLGSIIVTLFAMVLDTKISTGVIVPLLITADILAVKNYKQDVQWNHLKSLLPFIFIGLLIGVFVGDHIDTHSFKYLLAIIIITSSLIMLLLDYYDTKYIPQSRWFATTMGLGAGFTTMVGNLAGAFANVYFLALRFPKMQFIATTAWLFFIINLCKVPFHIFVWKTLTLEYAYVDLALIPFVILGFYLGFKVVKLINNEVFRKYIIWATMLGGFLILLKP